MNEERFIKHIRQYGMLAQRTRKSYAEVVSELVKLREAAIEREAMSDTEGGNARARMRGQLQREYAVHDAEFLVDGTG